MTIENLERIADVPYGGDSPYFTDNREFRVREYQDNTCKAQKSLERCKDKYEVIE